MDWFLQNNAFQIGDFVMWSPILQAMKKKTGQPIKVFFETPRISSLYIDCDFIEVLPERPVGAPTWQMDLVDKTKNPYEDKVTGYEYMFQSIMGDRPMPHPYVDCPREPQIRRSDRKHVAVFHGNHSNAYRFTKVTKPITRRFLVNKLWEYGFVPVLLGNTRDRKLFWSDTKFPPNTIDCIDWSLRDSVAALSQCDFFVSNNTGFFHIAGAIKKPGLVLWRGTRLRRWKSPFSGISYAVNTDDIAGVWCEERQVPVVKDSHLTAIDKYLRERA